MKRISALSTQQIAEPTGGFNFIKSLWKRKFTEPNSNYFKPSRSKKKITKTKATHLFQKTMKFTEKKKQKKKFTQNETTQKSIRRKQIVSSSYQLQIITLSY